MRTLACLLVFLSDSLAECGMQGCCRKDSRESRDDSTYKFTKGKRYEFRFTRSGSESDLVGLDCGPADATMA